MLGGYLSASAPGGGQWEATHQRAGAHWGAGQVAT